MKGNLGEKTRKEKYTSFGIIKSKTNLENIGQEILHTFIVFTIAIGEKTVKHEEHSTKTLSNHSHYVRCDSYILLLTQ